MEKEEKKGMKELKRKNTHSSRNNPVWCPGWKDVGKMKNS